MTAIVVLCYPVSEWPEGIAFGIIFIFGLMWLLVGWEMQARYCFLIQRGWTEKEKVSR